MKILGIDPGYGRLGFAIIEKERETLKALDFGLVETDKNQSVPDRLAHIHAETLRLIKKHSPDCLATEKQIFAANRTTALDVAKALGVVLLAAHESGIDWHEYTPNEVKLTVTGSGRADKKQIEFMVTRLLNLKTTPKQDDVADALAIAICHSHHEKLKRL